MQRLVAAGVLDDSKLTAEGLTTINKIKVTNEEIKMLQRFMKDLDLGPLELTNKQFKVFGHL